MFFAHVCNRKSLAGFACGLFHPGFQHNFKAPKSLLDVQFSSPLNVSTWLHELKGDEDEEFFKYGLINRFQLVLQNTKFVAAEMNNCKSSTDPSIRDKVEAQIVKEINVNNYVAV